MAERGVQAVVVGCQRVRKAQDSLRDAMREADRVLLEWSHTAGLSPVDAGAAVQAALLEAGWTEADVKRVGVSETGVLARKNRLTDLAR